MLIKVSEMCASTTQNYKKSHMLTSENVFYIDTTKHTKS